MRPAGGTLQESVLHEERLVHLLDRIRILAHGGRDGPDADRAALELLDDGAQDPCVHVIEPELVDVEHLQGALGDRGGDHPVDSDLREVAHAPQQTIGDPRRAARAAGDLGGAGGIDLHFEDVGGASHDRFEVRQRDSS